MQIRCVFFYCAYQRHYIPTLNVLKLYLPSQRLVTPPQLQYVTLTGIKLDLAFVHVNPTPDGLLQTSVVYV